MEEVDDPWGFKLGFCEISSFFDPTGCIEPKRDEVVLRFMAEGLH
jgi:hypothetical protein